MLTTKQVNNNKLIASIETQKKLRTVKQELGFIMDYECTILEGGCGKKFSQFYTIQKHLRVHTGEKPYKCTSEGCGKAFSQKNNLNRHNKIHADIRSYGCRICSKRFSTDSNLKQHKQVHMRRANRKIFTCKNVKCLRQFYHKSSLNKHIKKLHGNQVQYSYQKQHTSQKQSTPQKSTQNFNAIFSQFSLYVKQQISIIDEVNAITQEQEQKQDNIFDLEIFAKEPVNEVSTAEKTLTNEENLSQTSEIDFSAIGVQFDSLFEDVKIDSNKRKASYMTDISENLEFSVEPEITKKDKKTENDFEIFNFNSFLADEKDINEISNEFSGKITQPADELFSGLFDDNESLFSSESVPQTTFLTEGLF